MFVKDWVTSIAPNPCKGCLSCLDWKPPSFGSLKLNFDGSSPRNPRPGGFEGVIQDHLGNVTRIVAAPIEFCDSTKAEVMGFIMGLRELEKIGIERNGMVKGDSNVVVRWATRCS